MMMLRGPSPHFGRRSGAPQRAIRVAAAGAIILLFAGSLAASPLSRLAEPQPGRAMHESSWDRSGMNGDFVRVPPGATVTLLDYNGAGCIRRFWCTIAPRSDVAIHSQAILRMYWDDDPNPSVEVPIGAFFGVGFGEQRDYISLPLNETSGGYNCYWPMPFHKSARWTLTNLGDKQIDAFYYNIDFTALDEVPMDTRSFHAQFRRENPTTPGRSYTVLDVEGAGHYVGTALFMAGRALYFLEGDEEVFVDGAAEPAIRGTGAEDYFNSGWYYDRGTYSAPYHGLVIKEEQRISTYRWHIEDPIPFQRSLRFTIEHGTNNGVQADYSSVAYFYLAGPAPAPPPLPDDLLPSHPGPATKLVIDGAIEAEDLRPSVIASAGGTWVQDMGNWGYGEKWSNRFALFWSPGAPGSTLTIPLPAGLPESIVVRMVTGPDCGIVRLSTSRGDAPGDTVDLFALEEGVKEVHVNVPDSAGKSGIVLTFTGKNPASKGSLAAVDAFVPAPAN
jgi:hypothetical protein